MTVELSVIIPVYNEEDSLSALYERLVAVLPGVAASFEILFVDDGSQDRSWPLIQALGDRDRGVRGIRFSRNFGHQIAITAGLENARGRVVVIMDADLQDPPELIPEMMAKHHEGYEVVYAVRAARAGESWFKRGSAGLFYRLLGSITQVDIPVDTGDFRLIGPLAAGALRRLPERHRFTRGLVAWLGFRQVGVPFDRAARFAGRSKYPLRRMLRLASDGIFSFSHLPLQVATVLGVAVSLLGLAYIAVVVALAISGTAPTGHAVLLAAILLLGGAQLLAVGLLGEYLGRVFDEVKGRPLFLVQETVGDELEKPSR